MNSSCEEKSRILMSARNRRVVLSARARSDLRSVALYGEAHWGTARSSAYQAEITSLLASLAQFPELGRRTHLFSGDARVISVGRHLIYYQHDPDELRIIRVLHMRVDADDLIVDP